MTESSKTAANILETPGNNRLSNTVPSVNSLRSTTISHPQNNQINNSTNSNSNPNNNLHFNQPQYLNTQQIYPGVVASDPSTHPGNMQYTMQHHIPNNAGSNQRQNQNSNNNNVQTSPSKAQFPSSYFPAHQMDQAAYHALLSYYSQPGTINNALSPTDSQLPGELPLNNNIHKPLGTPATPTTNDQSTPRIPIRHSNLPFKPLPHIPNPSPFSPPSNTHLTQHQQQMQSYALAFMQQQYHQQQQQQPYYKSQNQAYYSQYNTPQYTQVSPHVINPLNQQKQPDSTSNQKLNKIPREKKEKDPLAQKLAKLTKEEKKLAKQAIQTAATLNLPYTEAEVTEAKLKIAKRKKELSKSVKSNENLMCICRKVYQVTDTELDFCVQCDCCDQWFHGA